MKRLLVSLIIIYWCAVGVVYAAITPEREHYLVNHARPFGEVIFDTSAIQPAEFSEQHSLDNATAYVKSMCNYPGLHCVSIVPHEIWIDVFPKLKVRTMMKRLNRFNVALFYRNWLVVPTKWHGLHDWDFSPMPLYRNTHHKPMVVINLHKFAFGAYNKDGKLLRWGPASSGGKICPDDKGQSCTTPTGAFRVFKIGNKDCISRTYPRVTKGGAPMPYCMFFKGGIAMHASTMMGFANMSSGCVRLFLSDAEWLNHNFIKMNTRVDVIT